MTDQPHRDPDLLEGWRETNEFLIEDVLDGTGDLLTYKGWVEAQIEIQFDVWREEGPEYASTYFEYVGRLYDELRFLRVLELKGGEET